jgi:hypothetical protein
MIRWSIFGNKEKFKSALIAVYELISKGANQKEIIETLSSSYQERDIEKLLQWIVDLPKTNQFTQEKMLLKMSLWVILVYKLFFLLALLKMAHVSITWEIGIIIFAPILNIIGLVLVYRVIPSSYILVFFLFTFSLSNMGDNIISLFSFDSGITAWILTFIYILTFFIGWYYSFKLFRALPEGLIRTKKIIEHLSLNTKVITP